MLQDRFVWVWDLLEDLQGALESQFRSFSRLEVLGEVSGDLPEGLQGALGSQSGLISAPEGARRFSGRSPESSPSASDLEKSSSGIGEHMIFKIDEKRMNEREKHK